MFVGGEEVHVWSPCGSFAAMRPQCSPACLTTVACSPCFLGWSVAQVAGVAGSSATYAALCDVFAKQGKWDKLRTAVQVKGAFGRGWICRHWY